jgi:glucose/arabinose dehydrogenase
LKRLSLFFGAACTLIARTALASTATIATPVITEPAADGQVVNPYDVHMVAGPFAGSAGETHVCTDWEIRTYFSDTVVWSAPCAAGSGLVHVHLGDGTFTGLLEGRHQLNPGNLYRLRVRFLGDAAGGSPPADASEWAVREFETTAATAIQPLVLSDVSAVPPVRWENADAAGLDVVLPGSGPGAARLRLFISGGGTALTVAASGASANEVTNPGALSGHGAVRAILEPGDAPLELPETVFAFTDGSGADREIFLPAVTLAAGETTSFWISEGGGAFADASNGDPNATPGFSLPLTEPPVPWALSQPGFRVERFATGLRLPVNIAFPAAPGPGESDPFLYVTELYGTIRMVARDGTVSDYATDLLNFDPTGGFPGSGEKGLAGIAVDPVSGDVFVSSVFAVAGEANFHYPEVLRLHSTDGGRTAASRTAILHFDDEPMGASHQTSSVSFGPDQKLYVHIGDGLLTTPAQDIESVRGKILRVNLDGTAPADNPHYSAADGLNAEDLVYAWGLRNPFGGAWRLADGALWVVENGPGTDRLAKIVAGRNYLWDGSDASMHNFAAYLWNPSHAPVNLAFTQLSTFGGSGFPAEKLDRVWVTESGPTYAPGPQSIGKRISEFVVDGPGNLVAGPLPLIEYVGAGHGTAVGLAAGPDGLYFTDLYKNFDASTPTDAGASVFRIVWTGIADFTSEVASGAAPLAVQFHYASTSSVPSPTAWHWEFGDGETSDEADPVHVYRSGGVFDVRLTVTGSGGTASRHKVRLIEVGAPVRELEPQTRPPRPAPRTLPPR